MVPYAHVWVCASQLPMLLPWLSTCALMQVLAGGVSQVSLPQDSVTHAPSKHASPHVVSVLA